EIEVRLSGEDSGRGIFSHRHSRLVDQVTEKSLDSSYSLVLWEGHFGDFANGAQIMIDQFIA
ncbi:hypothetical protein X798_05728, partial [Onchocerca flexuosa]